MLCGSQHYIYLIDRGMKSIGVTRISKHYIFRKEVQVLEGAYTCTLYYCDAQRMYEPQYICEKYCLTLLILLGLDNSGVELIQ